MNMGKLTTVVFGMALVASFGVFGVSSTLASVCDYSQPRYTTPLQAAQAWHGFASIGIGSHLPASCSQSPQLADLHKELASRLVEMAADPSGPSLEQSSDVLMALEKINSTLMEIEFLHSDCARQLMDQSDYLLLVADTFTVVSTPYFATAALPQNTQDIAGKVRILAVDIISAFARAYENRNFDMEKSEMRQSYLSHLCTWQRIKQVLTFLQSQLSSTHTINARVSELEASLVALETSPQFLIDALLATLNEAYDYLPAELQFDKKQVLTRWIVIKATLDAQEIQLALENIQWTLSEPSARAIPNDLREKIQLIIAPLKSGQYSHASLAQSQSAENPLSVARSQLDSLYALISEMRIETQEVADPAFSCITLKSKLGQTNPFESFLENVSSLVLDNQQLGYNDSASQEMAWRFTHIEALRTHLLTPSSDNSRITTPVNPLAAEDLLPITAQSSAECASLARRFMDEMTLLLADVSFEASRSDRSSRQEKQLKQSRTYKNYMAWQTEVDSLRNAHLSAKTLQTALASSQMSKTLDSLASAADEITELLFEEESRALIDHTLDRSPTLAWLRHLQLTSQKNLETFNAIARNTREQPHPSEINTYLNPATLPNICAAMTTARNELVKSQGNLQLGMEFCREFDALVTQGNHEEMNAICQQFPNHLTTFKSNTLLKSEAQRMASWMADAKCPQNQNTASAI